MAEAGSAGVPGAGYALHAALCAGAAAWLVVGRDRGLRRGRLLFAGSGVDGVRPWWGGWPRGARWDWRRVPREWGCLVVAGVAAALGESVLPLFAGAAAVPLAGRWLRRRERERARAKRAEGVVALCGAVTAELRAGREPGPALLAGVRDSGVLGAAEAGLVAAVRFGGDVPLALREAAREPGGEGLAGVAACWRVAVDGGAGLAEGLERLEGALRAELEQRAELRARLAGAWSTVVVLALLPAVGLLLGGALGAEPLRVLLHTPAGLGCLVVGAGLEAAGLWWAGRIVRRGAGDAG
ncbi:type II secretion system F family protein [Streptomyces sp. NPDC050504]|uniref:type II secretion system F family protein n=1 Tax=Streptomyces sp. NPDC050504 TaxID=3365618 RepID=UPI0037A395C0